MERKMIMAKKYYLISHGEYAKGLKSALEMIAGPQESVQSFCLMSGCNPNDLISELMNTFDEKDEVVILGDMAGGSMCNAAMRLSLLPNVVLVSGINLPLAMEIVLTKATKKGVIDSIILNVRQSIKILSLEMGNNDSPEDDLFV